MLVIPVALILGILVIVIVCLPREEDLIGKVCRVPHGHAIILYNESESWVCLRLDGCGDCEIKEPEIIANSIKEYYDL